jgi:hypothetical protein
MVVHNLIKQLVISCSDMLRARLIIFGLDYLRAGVSYVVYTEHLLDSA